HPPRFTPQHRTAFRENRCSAEEGRIIDTPESTSRKIRDENCYERIHFRDSLRQMLSAEVHQESYL
ncbi:MAG: hypothetical protein KA800_04860, partial [Thauera sp.]|nr:hypothetical protein [Thauera sp.]